MHTFPNNLIFEYSIIVVLISIFLIIQIFKSEKSKLDFGFALDHKIFMIDSLICIKVSLLFDCIYYYSGLGRSKSKYRKQNHLQVHLSKTSFNYAHVTFDSNNQKVNLHIITKFQLLVSKFIFVKPKFGLPVLIKIVQLVLCAWDKTQDYNFIFNI